MRSRRMTHNDGSLREKLFREATKDEMELQHSISSEDWHHTYYGHELEHLETVNSWFRQSISNGDHDGMIYLIGDSSLDNKFWLNNKADDQAKAVNGYDKILKPPRSKKDVAYWLNKANVDNKAKGLTKYGVLNCSVEESRIESRSRGKLLPQDQFVKDHITSQDVVVVSVGGNDIALFPQICTIANMLCLTKCTTLNCMETQACGTALPCDDYLYGCSTGCCSTFLAWPLGLGYFIHLMKTRIEAYLNNIVSSNSNGNLDRKPQKILVCAIYYPSESSDGSWADHSLSALGYNSDPAKLQCVIRKIFELAMSQVRLPNHPEIEIVGVPLFAALDGKDPEDYKARVEPSSQGGEKMANLIMKAVQGGNTAISAVYDEHCRKDAAARRGEEDYGSISAPSLAHMER